MILASVFVLLFALIVIMLVTLRLKHMDVWIVSYIRQTFHKHSELAKTPVHILFSFVDHYEPQWGKDVTIEKERERVDDWVERYPSLARKHIDADGYHPQHTFYYPEEEYRFEHLDKLAKLCADGFGEIEVHLHHDNDTSENLKHSILAFCNTLHDKHGALPVNPNTGQLMYGFIHGNWTLDNSGPDGRFCGVNDELHVLRDTGCYADFTFPSAPHPTQPKTINSIYYAVDDPAAPKSHDTGTPVTANGRSSGDLMLVNGPLMLNWKSRKFGIMPRIENSDIRDGMEPTQERVDLWVKANIHVKGRADWLVIKVHTHGVQENDRDILLGEPVDQMFHYLGSKYNDGKRYCLHYVNSRELYNIIKAAEDGKTGNPNNYRDYILPRPSFKYSRKSS